ncbi:MAG TPA: hypothetical protein VFB27_14825 [Opitutaceae bacterium]|nr:hypothetical protein [Opitutaceae bacterium]
MLTPQMGFWDAQLLHWEYEFPMIHLWWSWHQHRPLQVVVN